MDASHIWPGILQFWGGDPDEFTSPYRFTKAERRKLKRLQHRHRKLVRQLGRNGAEQDRLCHRAKARKAEEGPPMQAPRFADETQGPAFVVTTRDPDNPPNPDFSHLKPPPMADPR